MSAFTGYDLVGLADVPPLFAGHQIGAFDLLGLFAVGGGSPAVAIVSPTPGTPLSPTDTITAQFTDVAAFRRLVVTALLSTSPTPEVVYDGAFQGAYAAGIATTIAGGTQLAFARAGGWPGGVAALTFEGVDVTGAEVRRTFTWPVAGLVPDATTAAVLARAAAAATTPAAASAGGPDFGTDIACLEDLDPSLRLIAGRAVLAQDIYHRLTTPRGGLFYDPSYGYDLRALLNESIAPATLPTAQAAIVAQCLLDERIATATATLTFNAAAGTLRLDLQLDTEAGPFRLVMSISAVTVDLLLSP